MDSWPLANIELLTPKLSLRLPTEQELDDLAQRSYGNILADGEAHFLGSWVQTPAPEYQWQFMQHHWRARANWKPEQWAFHFGIFLRESGEAIDSITLASHSFPRRRSVTTGSWLLLNQRRQGYGYAARAAVLTLAFECLDSVEARSSAHPDNVASHGVSYKLGYHFDGTEIVQFGDDDDVREVNRLVLKRRHWDQLVAVECRGVSSECLELFGVKPEV